MHTQQGLKFFEHLSGQAVFAAKSQVPFGRAPSVDAADGLLSHVESEGERVAVPPDLHTYTDMLGGLDIDRTPLRALVMIMGPIDRFELRGGLVLVRLRIVK